MKNQNIAPFVLTCIVAVIIFGSRVILQKIGPLPIWSAAIIRTDVNTLLLVEGIILALGFVISTILGKRNMTDSGITVSSISVAIAMTVQSIVNLHDDGLSAWFYFKTSVSILLIVGFFTCTRALLIGTREDDILDDHLLNQKRL